MPIYEYLCQDCAYKFELKQSMKDETVTTCPRCGKSVGRIISAPAIMFKGSGWYITDYSDKMKPPTEESPSPSTDEKKDAAASTTATPAAPATTPAATSSSGDGGGTGTTSTPSSTPSSGTPSSST